MHHEPVMLSEVLELITAHTRRAKILDGTLGLGGYSAAFLERFPDSRVLGLDRDESAISFSRERLKDYPNFSAVHMNFGELAELNEAFDVYVFDLGVSNMQITLPERGFSFQNDGLLDMRMNSNDDSAPTAADVLRNSDAKTLAKIFRDYGEERYADTIARAVKQSRTPITTTTDLVNVIRRTLPQPIQRKMGTHPARRVFQALRIYVNDEAGELERLLSAFPKISPREALIIFVAYHSLEDRIVKHTFRQWQNEGRGKIITKHPMTPSEEETARNYKARSAKLRAFCTNKD